MPERKDLRRPWITLACAWLLGFAMFAPILSLPPIEYIISKELLSSHAQASLLFAIPLIILAIIAIPGGILADSIGIRKATGIGAIIMAVSSFLRGALTDLASLFGLTALFGIGLALVYPNLPKLVGAQFPQEKAGLATGIYATGITFGCTVPLAITLPLVLPIANSVQGVFYIWSIPAMIAAILWWVVVKEPTRRSPRSQAIADGNRSCFWVLKNGNIWLVAFMLFACCFHFYTWSGWVPALMMLKGAPPDVAALIASVRGWVALPMIFLMPWASYMVGLRKPFLWSSAIVLALASWWAIFVTVPWGWLLMVVVGIPVGGTFSMILALPAELVPKEGIGAASGIVLSIGYVGGLLGAWSAGFLFDITGNFNLVLSILAYLSIAWVIVALIIPETGPGITAK